MKTTLSDPRSTSTLYDSEHKQFRETVAAFVERHVRPNAERWEAQGRVDRELFVEAAKAGILGFAIPEEYGGGGVEDFRFNAMLGEEVARNPVSDGIAMLTLENDIVFPYFTDLTNDEQKRRWLPGIAAGETVVAVAMTEPGAGSDLGGIRTSAVRDNGEYVINGSKTFISNGQNADLVLTVVRTSPDRTKGLSLIVVESDRAGFSRGRNLQKVGLHSQDTSELAFTDLRVPVANLVGVEGAGFASLFRNLPQERLSIAVNAMAASEGTFERTLAYVKERKAFGQSIGSFQNSRFVLAEIATELQLGRIYVDDCVRRHLTGELTAEDAAAAKWWCTELQQRVVNKCLQLYGGYGYMREYRIARDYEDARITTIYGGTTEIMKEIIGRSLGL